MHLLLVLTPMFLTYKNAGILWKLSEVVSHKWRIHPTGVATSSLQFGRALSHDYTRERLYSFLSLLCEMDMKMPAGDKRVTEGHLLAWPPGSPASPLPHSPHSRLCPPRCPPTSSDAHGLDWHGPASPCYSCSMLWPLGHDSSSRNATSQGITSPGWAGCRLDCDLLSCHHLRSTNKSKGPHKRPLNLVFP